jgi:hypothetical protein
LFAHFANVQRGGEVAFIQRSPQMKNLLLVLIAAHCVTPFAVASPAAKLGNFELTDQEANKRTYRFPKTKITVMTIADQKGADQLAPWIQRVYDRFKNQIDIDGVADVSMIPKLFQPILREAFKKRLAYSVMLDWDGSVVKQFAYEKNVANIYVIDRGGRIVKRLSGAVSNEALRALFRTIDAAIADAEQNDPV